MTFEELVVDIISYKSICEDGAKDLVKYLLSDAEKSIEGLWYAAEHHRAWIYNEYIWLEDKALFLPEAQEKYPAHAPYLVWQPCACQECMQNGMQGYTKLPDIASEAIEVLKRLCRPASIR